MAGTSDAARLAASVVGPPPRFGIAHFVVVFVVSVVVDMVATNLGVIVSRSPVVPIAVRVP